MGGGRVLGVGNDKEGHYTREELGTLCPRIVGRVSSCGHLSALSSDEDCLVLPPSGNLTDSSSSSLAAVIAFSSAVLKTGCVRGPFHPALRATCSTCAYIRTLPPGGDPPPHHLPVWRTPPTQTQSHTIHPGHACPPPGVALALCLEYVCRDVFLAGATPVAPPWTQSSELGPSSWACAPPRRSR